MKIQNSQGDELFLDRDAAFSRATYATPTALSNWFARHRLRSSRPPATWLSKPAVFQSPLATAASR